MRYEDLLINREYEMKRLYRFLYRTGNGDDQPACWDQRVHRQIHRTRCTNEHDL